MRQISFPRSLENASGNCARIIFSNPLGVHAFEVVREQGQRSTGRIHEYVVLAPSGVFSGQNALWRNLNNS